MNALVQKCSFKSFFKVLLFHICHWTAVDNFHSNFFEPESTNALDRRIRGEVFVCHQCYLWCRFPELRQNVPKCWNAQWHNLTQYILTCSLLFLFFHPLFSLPPPPQPSSHFLHTFSINFLHTNLHLPARACMRACVCVTFPLCSCVAERWEARDLLGGAESYGF